MIRNNPNDKHTFLTAKEAIILIQQTKDDDCINYPPSNPKSGSIYIYRYDTLHENDFTCAGMSWRCTGTRNSPKVNLKKRYYKRLGKISLDFRKCCYIYGNNSRVLIHYVGPDDFESEASPHGNNKSSITRPHVRTMPSVIGKMKVAREKPSKYYKESIVGKEVPRQNAQVGLPRNIKQVENAQ